jgi:hypothetical protein
MVEYSKIPKTGDYKNIGFQVTMKELVDMTEFIRNFQLKYRRKKISKKKK